MDFITQVNSVKNSVLNQPKYRIPIQNVIDVADKYTAEKNLEEKVELESEKN